MSFSTTRLLLMTFKFQIAGLILVINPIVVGIESLECFGMFR